MKQVYKRQYTPKTPVNTEYKWKNIAIPTKIFEYGKSYEIKVFELK